jgi:hypothetical protein
MIFPPATVLTTSGFHHELKEKASLEARALPSRTRDLTLSRQNHYKSGFDAPPYEFRSLAVANSVVGRL